MAIRAAALPFGLAAALALAATSARAQAPALQVVVNEIAWMGTLASANDEWIELRSNAAAPIDLTGWTLVASDGTPSIVLAGTIPPAGYFLLERTDDATLPGVTADQIYTGALVNTGEILELRTAASVLQDRVDAWYAGNSTTRATMQRVDPLAPGTDPANWIDGPIEGTPTNSGGSGGGCEPATNVVACELGGPFVFRTGGPIVINELMIDPAAVGDVSGEYVELYNSGTSPVDVAGWTLRDDDTDFYTIPAGVSIAAGATLVIAGNPNPAANGGFAPDLVWGTFFLNQVADEVVLVDALAVEQDRLVYAGAPWSGATGRSLERVSPRLPTGDPLSWVQARAALPLGDRGTPGAINTLQARHYLLGGTLVTLDESLPAAAQVFAGMLHVQGNRILDVLAAGDPLPADAAGAQLVASGGLVFPGLMNIHDHIAFDTLPAWSVPQLMADVSDWTALDAYRREIRYPHEILTDPDYYDLLPEVGKYAEVKALAAGTTAVQGSFPLSSGFTQHLARNVDIANFGADRVRQRSLSILDSTFLGQDAPALVADMEAGEVDAWLVHLGEGTAEDAPLEFPALRNVCLVRSETVIIHGTALSAGELDEIAAAGAKLIVAPTSNYLYYGATADIPGAVARGIDVSLSTDWSPAGDKNLLAALKSLSRLNTTVWSGALSDREMVEMVTSAPARTLNWCQRVGTLRAGMFADLAVVAGDPAAPYASLVEATEEDVLLTVVDGDPLYGRPAFVQSLKPGDSEIVTSACGFQAALDVTDPTVFRGDQLFSDFQPLLAAASLLDFQHMRANFADPTVAGMSDLEFQAYLAARFPLGLVPSSLDPHWVVDDADYFEGIRAETNVTALDPAASLDTESDWDPDVDELADACEYAFGTDPLLADSDSDGLRDGDEVNLFETEPLDADSDDDGFLDGLEVAAGSDPNDPASVPAAAAIPALRGYGLALLALLLSGLGASSIRKVTPA